MLKMDKAEALRRIAREMEADTSLPLREARLVFGEGSVESKVMFIGEAPGFHEDRLGRPFVGQAGQLLNQLLREIGWKREEVYITNIVKRRPPGNRDPLPEEIVRYQGYLDRQIAVLDPKVIVPLGRFAMNYFLPEAKMSRDHGKVFHVSGRIIVPLYHPAAALRSSKILAVLREEFHRLPEVVRSADSVLAAQKKSPSSLQPQLF
ncbi:uracil-DNA glycosylase [Candidatus Parcubacteria bacterium]|nr:MAG: uracil-DNA glycosylase [Candidatus Parcubacteria bacterium]